MLKSVSPRADQGLRKMALSYREAANALGVCERLVWQMVKDGHIQAFRCGKRSVRIAVSEIERFIAEQSQEGR
jgi:excisionase family DNA binding protein